jgi:hypothetical protein
LTIAIAWRLICARRALPFDLGGLSFTATLQRAVRRGQMQSSLQLRIS